MRTANVGRSLILPLLAFAFCTWAVYLGSLAATQRYCTDVTGSTTGQSGADIAGQQTSNALNTDGLQGIYTFSANVLYCSNVYRYHWFVAAFEFLLIVGALIAAATPYAIAHTRGFWVGMFSIATVLFMIMSEAFLAGISSNANITGRNLRAFQATAAGAIMTVVANIACLFAIGSDWERRGAHHNNKDQTMMDRPVGTGTTTTTGLNNV